MTTDKPSPALHYPSLLTDIKQRIGQAQTRAMLAVNAELFRPYWEIGQMLDARQKIEGWGAEAKIVNAVQSAHTARSQAHALLEAAKRAVEIAIEDSEAAALAFLKEHGA